MNQLPIKQTSLFYQITYKGNDAQKATLEKHVII